MIPPPPAGFDTEVTPQSNAGGSIPPPPAGFTNDVTPQDDYWGDVKKNAIEGIKQIPAGATAMARAASIMNPFQAGQSIFQHFAPSSPLIDQGVNKVRQMIGNAIPSAYPDKNSMTAPSGSMPWGGTETGQNIQAATSIARGLPGGLMQTGKDVGAAAAFPYQTMMNGTAPADTMLGQNFRERPLSTPTNIASVALPASKALFNRATAGAGAVSRAAEQTGAQGVGDAGAAAAEKSGASFPPVGQTVPQDIPNYLEAKGTQGLNMNVGLRGATVKKLTPAGANPGGTATQVLSRMDSEGAIGSSPAETFQKSSAIANQYGQQVRQAMDNIKSANQGMGTYPEMPDSLKVDAVSTLKPILDQANDLINNYDPQTGTLMKKMYDNLQTAANGQDGFLTIDNVRAEMSRVGKMFNSAAKNSDKWNSAATLYGELHNMQDAMVNDIASRAATPELATALKTANKGYSMYMRVLPDIANKAVNESLGTMTLPSMMEELKNAILSKPATSRGLMMAGKATKSIFQGAPQASAGQAVQGGLMGTLKDQRGSIFPASNQPAAAQAASYASLPEMAAQQSPSGAPHALYIGDQGTTNGSVPYGTIYGEHPNFRGTFPIDKIKAMGIPVIGREIRKRF